MPHLFVPPENITADSFRIEGAEAHHVIRVLRKKTNDVIQFFDGKGTRYEGRLTSVDGDQGTAVGKILKSETQGQQTIPRRRLFQGLPRGAKFDFVIEKATELGAHEIIPFLSQKNLIKLSSAQAQAKAGRWQRVANAAAKQCGRADIPAVRPVSSLKGLEPFLKEGASIVLWEKEQAQSLKHVLPGFQGKILNIIVGPESGFLPSEIEWLMGLGVRPVSVGRRILRSETAGLAVLAAVDYEFERE